MKSKKQLLKSSRVYAILDKGVCGRTGIRAVAHTIANSRVGIVQLRDKHSCAAIILREAVYLASVFKKTGTLFIVNDRADIAKLADADGVHVGQSDIPARAARAILGPGKIVGVSCSSLAQALKAQKEGADYVGVGPVFATPVKSCKAPTGTALIKSITQQLRIPVFAIGGINALNAKAIRRTGVTGVAVCRDICKAKRPELAAAIINKIFS